MNPTQLIWVQKNIRRERYHVLFKMTTRGKKRDVDYTVRTDADVACLYDTWQSGTGRTIRHVAFIGWKM
jgi:hypothetical protein